MVNGQTMISRSSIMLFIVRDKFMVIALSSLNYLSCARSRDINVTVGPSVSRQDDRLAASVWIGGRRDRARWYGV